MFQRLSIYNRIPHSHSKFQNDHYSTWCTSAIQTGPRANYDWHTKTKSYALTFERGLNLQLWHRREHDQHIPVLVVVQRAEQLERNETINWTVHFARTQHSNIVHTSHHSTQSPDEQRDNNDYDHDEGDDIPEWLKLKTWNLIAWKYETA